MNLRLLGYSRSKIYYCIRLLLLGTMMPGTRPYSFPSVLVAAINVLVSSCVVSPSKTLPQHPVSVQKFRRTEDTGDGD